MAKLQLMNITKTYRTGQTVRALDDVSLSFRENEFVSVFGPSGCGKTTMLNIIGGLDHYDEGDLIINGISTKEYKDRDWDAYRNRSIGFVFQSYNLISHQSALQNVEIALALSGTSESERRRRAKEALENVGLAEQINKRPNQLSGGQMQRVAIARALVNNPDIILADEPTGALDSQTSLQLMDILKEISSTRLVIMVTHNRELADRYSNRIIHLLDGKVLSDSNPIEEPSPSEEVVQTEKKKDKRVTSMSMFTAASLSLKNLLTKKGRTFTTAFAGSIGIIGVALVLALSNGLSSYMDSLQTDALSGFPITVNTYEQSFEQSRMENPRNRSDGGYEPYPQVDTIYRYDADANTTAHTNILSEDYLEYVGVIRDALPGAVNTVTYHYGAKMNLLAKGEEAVLLFENTSQQNPFAPPFATGVNSYWQEMPDNDAFVLSLYDLIGESSRLPANKNEIALVVDEYNRLDDKLFEMLGIPPENADYSLEDFLNRTMLKVIYNDDFYTQREALFIPANADRYGALFDGENGVELTIVGILRIKESATSSYFSQGFVYTSDLTRDVLSNAKNSAIATAQTDSVRSVLTNAPFPNEDVKKLALLNLGADTTPTAIDIYPMSFESKEEIKEYLDMYNEGKADDDQVIYTDMAETISNLTGTLLDIVSYVLIGFASISLVVSTIMIGIITYVSVIERTKEIGILRSVGARKKDISRVFNAETLIIGFSAGIMGVAISYLLSFPINLVIFNLSQLEGIADLNLLHGLLLIAGSMVLTLIAGFLPSRIAANKDPVEALRTE